MFIIKKNQVIITALVVMIAAAGYLNYIDSGSNEAKEVMLNDESDTSGIVGDELTQMEGLNDEVSISAESVDSLAEEENKDKQENKDNNSNKNNTTNQKAENDNDDAGNELADNEAVAVGAEESEAGEAVFVNSSKDSSYFVQAKLEREQSRAKQKDILTEMINNGSVEQNKKAECADEMLKIQQRIEKETAAEAMIEAKGFSEVYVRIDDDTVDVVVNKDKLSQQEIAQIEDIVKRKTGYSADKIRISPAKK